MHGSISGNVVRASDGSGVAGAHVVCRGADGRTAGGALSAASGRFVLSGLPPDTYTVYVTPLDEPVAASNLTSPLPVDTDFEPRVVPFTVPLSEGADVPIGSVSVGDDVAISLGRNFDRYPRRVISGLTNLVLIRGTGLYYGCTLESSVPEVVVQPIDWVGFQVNFQAIVAPGAAPGHVDLKVMSPTGEIDILPAALEITPPSPTVTSVVPDVVGTSGGTVVDVYGTGFRAGARVVVGDEIYVDGEGGCDVVSDTNLRLTMRAGAEGTRSVVVIDETGVEGRMTDALAMTFLPRLDVVFPAAGDAAGGTSLTLSGADFLQGATVEIGGVVQPNVTFVDSETLAVVTAPSLSPGPGAVEVANPNGHSASLASAFEYTVQPDPRVDQVEPFQGSELGGEPVVLRGENMAGVTEVRFGVDPTTGAGGTLATDVVHVDATTVEVTTPAHAAGTVAVLVRDGGTGQAAMLPSGFTFEAEPPAAGGGGGCAAVRTADPSSAWWMVALALVLALQSSRAQASQASVERSASPCAARNSSRRSSISAAACGGAWRGKSR